MLDTAKKLKKYFASTDKQTELTQKVNSRGASNNQVLNPSTVKEINHQGISSDMIRIVCLLTIKSYHLRKYIRESAYWFVISWSPSEIRWSWRTDRRRCL